MHIILMPVGGEFAEGFNESFISFGYDLEGVKMTSFKENKGNYEIIITVPKGEKEENGYSYDGSITLKKGSMVKRNGEVVNEELSVTRGYTPDTIGRSTGFNSAQVSQLQEIVGGFGNTTAGTIGSVISSGGSVLSAGWMMLGLLGYVPNDASRHAEVMSALAQIQGQLNEIQTSVNIMRDILNEHTLMLTDLKITMDEFYLNDIGGDMILLTSLGNEYKDQKTEEIPVLSPSGVTDKGLTPAPTITQPTVPSLPAELITIPKKPTNKKPSVTKNKITVNWKHFKQNKKTKPIWKKIKKVQVQCATDSAFSNIVKSAMVGKKKTKATIKGLAKKTTYYVRVRYYDGTGYSAWSGVKKVKTKK